MTQSIKLNFFFNILLQLSKVLFPLITAPYVARVLAPEGVGLSNFLSTYSSYFALFAVLGIPIYGIREIAKYRNDLKASETLVSQLISIELITTLLMSLLYILSIIWIDQLRTESLLFLVTGISLFLTPFKIEWFFQGREEFGYITFRSLLIKTISVIALFVVVKTESDLLNFVLLNLFASIANEIWNYIKLFKLGIRPKICFKGCKQHLKPVFTLFASSVAISIYTMLDTLMLGFQSSYTEVGYYNNAMHVVKTILSVTTSLSAVVLPRIALYMSSGEIGKINELMTRSLGIVTLLAFPVTIGIIMIAPVFVPLFFGQEFYGAILPMQIGAGVIVAIGLNNLNGIQILIAIGKDKLFFTSVACGAISNFLINLILIPIYGAAGAAIASVYAEIQILMTNEYFVRKETQIRIQKYSDMILAIAGSLLIIPVCVLMNLYLSGWILIIVDIVVCGAVYAVSQLLFKNKTFSSIYVPIINRIKK